MSEETVKTENTEVTTAEETKPVEPVKTSGHGEGRREDHRSSEGGPGPRRQDRGHDDDERGGGGKFNRFKKKACRFCQNADVKIDYKNYSVLERFITDRGKILPRRITGTCSKHQRILSREIKRARILALLPFVLQ